MTDLSNVKVAILGAGNMGFALLEGALRAGVKPENLTATVWDTASNQLRLQKYQVGDAGDFTLGQSELSTWQASSYPGTNSDAVADAQLVIVAVKPYQVAEVLTEIRESLKRDAVVVSVAVGLDLKTLAANLNVDQPLVRAMPNTPAAVGKGITAISPGLTVSDNQLALAEAVLKGSGGVVIVPEKYQPAVGAISGSGPAYVAYVIDALIEAGVQQGLPRDVATALAVSTFEGTAAMLAQTGEHPALARERVTSPGGTTAAALAELDNSGVRAAINRAVAAAINRTNQIAKAG